MLATPAATRSARAAPPAAVASVALGGGQGGLGGLDHPGPPRPAATRALLAKGPATLSDTGDERPPSRLRGGSRPRTVGGRSPLRCCDAFPGAEEPSLVAYWGCRRVQPSMPI